MYKIEVVDNSIINTMLECPRSVYYQYILGLSPTTLNPAIHLGSVVHSGLAEHYSVGKNPEVEIVEKFSPELVASTTHGLNKAITLWRWFREQPEPFKTICEVEIGFTVNLDGYLYGGIMDLIARVPGYDGLVVIDHKITSSPSYYLNNLSLNRQMTGYILATTLLYGSCNTAILHAVVHKPSFQRLLYPTQRNEKALNSWIVETKNFIDQLLSYQEKGFWPRSAKCGRSYSPCPFIPYCVQFPEALPALTDFGGGFAVVDKWEPWFAGKLNEKVNLT